MKASYFALCWSRICTFEMFPLNFLGCGHTCAAKFEQHEDRHRSELEKDDLPDTERLCHLVSTLLLRRLNVVAGCILADFCSGCFNGSKRLTQIPRATAKHSNGSRALLLMPLSQLLVLNNTPGRTLH